MWPWHRHGQVQGRIHEPLHRSVAAVAPQLDTVASRVPQVAQSEAGGRALKPLHHSGQDLGQGHLLWACKRCGGQQPLQCFCIRSAIQGRLCRSLPSLRLRHQLGQCCRASMIGALRQRLQGLEPFQK